ncbi:sugar phosphate isomerase/epimerase [Chryseolinea sp. T2]|uniref:sugar phosphate isomerase/epimerase family protein n=1 Tax=Chryseolinea sp. T2 TaxID=3129255 RepID=UPI0030788563
MINRRQFIKASATAMAVSLPAWSFIQGRTNAMPAPGVQLFTFFNTMDNDVAGTVRAAAEVGLKNIESAFSKKGDYYGMKAKAFADLLKSSGMQWRSHHVFGAPLKPRKDANGNPISMPALKNLKENLSEILDDAKAGGLQYLVAAHLPIGTADEIKSSLDILNASAGPCKKAGIQLVYHNEPADFKNIEGKIPYEVFLKETDSDELKFELDIAWAIKAGQDPEQLFNQYSGRFPLWHIKDLSQDYQTVLPVGEGVLNYNKYFTYATKSALKYYFIEHESAQDPIASIGKSIKTIQTITS